MKRSAKRISLWFSLSPWAILGGLALLAPLAFFLASTSIRRDRENMTRLLVEKGAALIRSFEAGARTGMMGMGWGGSQVQRLLVETAKQPDILYLVVTDENGGIVAHSSSDKIHQIHSVTANASWQRSEKLQWRHVKTQEGDAAFEVYRQFRPLSRPSGPAPLPRRGMGRLEGRHIPRPHDGSGPDPGEPRDWCRPFWDCNGPGEETAHYIFVGLDIAPLETARTEAQRHTVVMTAGLLLIAFAGMISLFMAQGYRLAKRSLAKVRAFSDQVVESLPAGLIAVDENGHIAAFNEAAETILGKSKTEALGRQAETFLPPALWELTGLLRRAGMVMEQDVDCRRETRSVLPLRVSAALLTEDDGSPLGSVFIFRDLSEVRRLQQELERSRRLASLGSLAAGVAHEIRNPLSSIKGFATYFKERLRGSPSDRETATTMIEEVERLDRVIGQLLEFARPSTLKVTPVDLKDLVDYSLRLVDSDARAKGIHVRSVVPDALAPVAMDRDRMSQVLLNLYLNAIQAMEQGGSLTVSVSRNEAGDSTHIVVADTGAGMSVQDRERIFDPYFTTKADGTGLGLAIVHKIMEAHGGEVVVDSTPGRGTTFVLVLPDPKEGAPRVSE